MSANNIHDLLGAPPGLRYAADFLTVDDEDALLKELAKLDWDGRGVFRRRGRVVKRQEIDFIYNYGRYSRKLAEDEPLPGFLDIVRS